MSETSKVGRWFLGFVLWFAGLAIFLGRFQHMGKRGVLIALLSAVIVDSLFAIIFRASGNGFGGFARWLVGFMVWFAVLAVIICWIGKAGMVGVRNSLIAALVLDSLFAFINNVLFMPSGSGGSSGSFYIDMDDLFGGSDTGNNYNAGYQRSQMEEYQPRVSSDYDRQNMMEEGYRQEEINNAMAAHYYGNEEAANAHWNEANK